MNKTAKHVGRSKTSAKSSTPEGSKTVVKNAGRANVYRQHFKSSIEQINADGFFKQVNGYGTPVYSQVGSFAGV